MFSKQNKTVFSGEIATNGRKRYFHIGENASSKQIYALFDDVESADEDDIDNLIDDSDTKFIVEEEITQAASTQDTSLTTPVANLHVVAKWHQSKKKEKNKKEELWKWNKKIKVAKQEVCLLGARNATQSKWNSFPNRNIFFGDQPRRATKKLHSYQGRTETTS